MKKLNYLFLIALIAIVGFSSCSKDGDINQEEVEDVIENPSEVTSNPLTRNLEENEDGALDLGCFTIDFPFSLNVNGDEVAVEDITDFETVLEGLTEDDAIDFVYPLAITYQDGETGSVDDAEGLGEAWAECIPDDGWVGYDGIPAYLINDENACFDLVYPVDLTDGENTYTAESEEEFVQLLIDNEILFFTFPLMVTTEEGEVVELADGDALFELLFTCDDSHAPCDSLFDYEGEIMFGCYQLGFPVTLSTVDGGEVTANNQDELIPLFIDGSVTGFVYPITLIDEDGNSVVVNSEEEFGDALTECEGIFNPFDQDAPILLFGSESAGGMCYSINYPITIGSTAVNNFDEALATLESEDIALSYPITVTLIESGEEVELNNGDDIFELYETCEF